MKQVLYGVLGVIVLLILNSCSSDNAASTNDPGISDPVVVDKIVFENAVSHNPSFLSDHFSGSQNCVSCHDNIRDSNGTNMSIVNAWQSSMMSVASIDPLWRAKVASEVKRNPEYKDTIEEKCSRCHTPMANVEAKFSGDTVALFENGFFNPSNPHYDSAINGVSCTLCHQIEDSVDLGSEAGFSGNFIILENFSTARKSYGPYTSPVAGPMRNNIQFTPEYSPHTDRSELCASCHNLNTPVIDAQGNLSGSTFPEQAVYTEWENSDFNATQNCQDCHMPKSKGSVVISTRGPGLQGRSPFHQHQFIGANTYMLDIIKNNRRLLGALADAQSFDETIINTRYLLLATADVNITSTSSLDGKLNFTVLLTNHSGHKFPTSLPSRRAWLHAKVINNQGQTVFESGAFNSENKIVGVDDVVGANGYERHHKEITDGSEVQVYETVMADTDGQLTYTFMNASRYLKDNRILPKGFKVNDAPATVQPYGLAVSDSDFVGGSDTIEYSIDNIASGDYMITVALNYQTLSFGFSQDLFKDSELIEVALMKALDNNATVRYETISLDAVPFTFPQISHQLESFLWRILCMSCARKTPKGNSHEDHQPWFY